MSQDFLGDLRILELVKGNKVNNYACSWRIPVGGQKQQIRGRVDHFQIFSFDSFFQNPTADRV